MNNQNTPEFLIAELLSKKGMTLGLAESCTGGLVSHRITNIPGSSEYYRGGVVAYSNDAKTFLLYVSRGLFKKHGAVSKEVACAMAKGAKDVLDADHAAAITGIAGPTGGSRKKPVGLAYIAFASRKGIKSKEVLFEGDRDSLKKQFAEEVLNFILKNLE